MSLARRAALAVEDLAAKSEEKVAAAMVFYLVGLDNQVMAAARRGHTEVRGVIHARVSEDLTEDEQDLLVGRAMNAPELRGLNPKVLEDHILLLTIPKSSEVPS